MTTGRDTTVPETPAKRPSRGPGFFTLLSWVLLIACVWLYIGSYRGGYHAWLFANRGMAQSALVQGGKLHVLFSNFEFDENPWSLDWQRLSMEEAPTLWDKHVRDFVPPGSYRGRWGFYHAWQAPDAASKLRMQAVTMPMWAPTAFFALLPLLSIRSGIRRWRRKRTGKCVECGYDLRYSAGACPECGMER